MTAAKKLRAIIVFCVIFGLPGYVLAEEEAKVGPWVEVNKKDGFTAYLRTTSRSKMEETKAVGIIHAPVQVLENILREPSNWQKIIFMAKEVKKIDTPANMPSDAVYLYGDEAMPWPVANRAFVGKLVVAKDNQNSEVKVSLKNVTTDYKFPAGAVVAPIVDILWTLKPMPDGSTYVTAQGLGDLGGQIPAKAVNFLLKYIALKSIINLQNLAVKA